VTASKRIVTAITDCSALGPLGPPLSKDDGESLTITPLVDDPSLLLKRYRPGTCGSADDDRLDRLIAIPRRLGTEDRSQLRRASCWPVSRVVENGRTIGVLMPRAPDKFNAALRSLTGIGERKPLAIDWLAKGSHQQAQRGLPATTFDQRIKVCCDIAAVAAIMEREDIVYGDWSYANALWSVSDFSGYLIDVDGCSFGPKQWIATPNWEDPLTPQGTLVDVHTDRYRLAVMIARCLTGKRDVGAALAAVGELSLDAGRPGIALTLTTAINSRYRLSRPSVETILRSLAPPSTGNVSGWKPVGKPADRQPASSAARPRVVWPPYQSPPLVPPPARPSVPAPGSNLTIAAAVAIAVIVIPFLFLVVLLFR
jgi:hypothetical protein